MMPKMVRKIQSSPTLWNTRSLTAAKWSEQTGYTWGSTTCISTLQTHVHYSQYDTYGTWYY